MDDRYRDCNKNDVGYDIHDMQDQYLELKHDGLFSIGQVYEKEPAETYYCSHCGNNEFYVGSSSYFTAIMCVSCKRELCIHDG